MLPLRMTTAANAVVPAGVLPFTEQLPTLADLGVINATGGGTATIDMVNATHQFHSGLAATPTFAYRPRVARRTTSVLSSSRSRACRLP